MEFLSVFEGYAGKKFSKEIPLPFPVNQAKISYTFQNGLLNIILPIESDNENPIPISF